MPTGFRAVKSNDTDNSKNRDNMKRILVRCAILVAGLIAFAGCSDDDLEITRDFEIDSDEAVYDSETNTINFKGARSTASVRVVTEDATGKWDARCPTDDLWCSFSKDRDQLVVTVAENKTDAMRRSHITIVLDGQERTVNVAQDYVRTLSFASERQTVGAASGSYRIGITTNILPGNLSFSVLDEQGNPAGADFWLEKGDYADGMLNFSVHKNRSESEDRIAQLVVSGDETQAVLIVTQNMASGKPYIVSLAELNYEFDTCLSYEIWDRTNNIKVGNICREYLLKGSPDGVSVQTVGVVAYPIRKGVVDHTNGFVLATIDVTTGNVMPDGGTLMWNSAIDGQTSGKDMIASYVPGTLSSLPESIYIPLGGSTFGVDPLDAEDQEYAVEAEIAPWVVTDRREGAEIAGRGTFDEFEYRVVKVGNQYWFADNLKTTRFRDGSPIPSDNWTATSTIEGPQCASAGYTSDGTSYSNANANAITDAAVAVRNQTGPVFNFLALFNAGITDVTNAFVGPFDDVLAPDGWGVPTREEFTILSNYITQCSEKPDSDPKLELVLNTKYETTATNITGFGATCYRYRSATGTNSSNGIHYAVADGYNFAGVAGAGAATDHKTVAFCCGKDTNTTFRAAEVRWGIYVRCIRRDASPLQ